MKINDIKKIYSKNALVNKLCYKGETVYHRMDSEGGETVIAPKFAVVVDITAYTQTVYDWVYNNADRKWYTKNNNGVYEKYGVIESVDDLETATKYVGKLVVCDGHEYKWNGSSWSDLGEITEGGINFEYGFNFNARDFDSANSKIPNYDSNASVNTDLIFNSIPSSSAIHEDFITIGSSTQYANVKGYNSYVCRVSGVSGKNTITIISKAKTTSPDANLVVNREGQSYYNWMYRNYQSRLTLHGTSETGQISCSSSEPNILAVRVDENDIVYYNNYTNNTSSSTPNFTFGQYQVGSQFTFFSGYNGSELEKWYGDFYWCFMSNRCLTDAEVQAVIDYNENGSCAEYVETYTEKYAPPTSVEFDTVDEMNAYTDVYVGLTATVGSKMYKYTEDMEWSEVEKYILVEGNNQWIFKTNSNIGVDGYTVFKSFSNKGVINSTATMKVKFFGYESITFKCRSYGESGYDYLIVGGLNKAVENTTSTTNNKYHFQGKQSATVWTDVTFDNLNPSQEYYVEFMYRKDGSGDSFDDCAYVGVPYVFDYQIRENEYIIQDNCSNKINGNYYELKRTETEISLDDGLTWQYLYSTDSTTNNTLSFVVEPKSGYYGYMSTPKTYNNITYDNFHFYKYICDVVTLPNGNKKTFLYTGTECEHTTPTQRYDGIISSTTTLYTDINDFKIYPLYYVNIIDATGEVYTTDKTEPNFDIEIETRVVDNGSYNYINGVCYKCYDIEYFEDYMNQNVWKPTRKFIKSDEVISIKQEYTIPSEYTELEYLKNGDGNNKTKYSVIDTEWYNTNNTKYKVLCRWSSSPNSYDSMFSRDGVPRFNWMYRRKDYYNSMNYVTDTDPTSLHVFELSKNGAFRDSVLLTEFNNNTEFTDKITSSLFAASVSQTDRGYTTGKSVIYYAEIWEGDEMVRQFVPAKRNEDGVLGMYECIQGKFHTDCNDADTFVAGPEVTE